ncbi:MAG: hypothetical protein QM791_06310 [Ferruginibacter sp.]
MKNILQAATLIIIAASAIVVAANSHHTAHETCNHEWEQQLSNSNLAVDSNKSSQSNLIQQEK